MRISDWSSDVCSSDLLDVASTFLDMGFDSLFLTQLATTFQREYGLKITFRQLFDELPTLRALAEYIDSQLPPEVLPAANPATVTTPATPQRVESPAQPAAPAEDRKSTRLNSSH